MPSLRVLASTSFLLTYFSHSAKVCLRAHASPVLPQASYTGYCGLESPQIKNTKNHFLLMDLDFNIFQLDYPHSMPMMHHVQSKFWCVDASEDSSCPKFYLPWGEGTVSRYCLELIVRVHCQIQSTCLLVHHMV